MWWNDLYAYALIFGVGGFIGSSLLPNNISFAVRYASVALIAFGCVMFGAAQERLGWQVKERDYRIQVADLDSRLQVALNRSPEITTEVVTKYVDRIREVERVVKVEVDRFVPVEQQCTINNGFVRLHDAAALLKAIQPNETDLDPSKVDLNEVAKVLTENYRIHHQTREQLVSLQQWIREQEKLWAELPRSSP